MLEETGLPYEPHLVDFGKETRRRRNFSRSIRTARSRRSSIPTARAASRSACSSRARSCSYLAERPASCCRPIRRGAGETIQWVHFQMGGDRADVRAGRLLQQVRRQGLRGQAPARALRRRVEAAARRDGAAARRPRLVHGRRIHHRRRLDARLGAQPDQLLRGARAGRVRHAQACAGLARARAGAAGGAARAEYSEAAVERSVMPGLPGHPDNPVVAEDGGCPRTRPR